MGRGGAQRGCVAKLQVYVHVTKERERDVYGENTTSRIESLVKGRVNHGHMYRGALLASPRESQNARYGLLDSKEAEVTHSLHASYFY